MYQLQNDSRSDATGHMVVAAGEEASQC